MPIFDPYLLLLLIIKYNKLINIYYGGNILIVPPILPILVLKIYGYIYSYSHFYFLISFQGHRLS